MKKPHVHAELIKAWADGAEIEYRDRHNDWVALPPCGDWDAHPDFEYRIKPAVVEPHKPKPDVVVYPETATSWEGNEKNLWFVKNYLKLTFDGETGKLKSAEVL